MSVLVKAIESLGRTGEIHDTPEKCLKESQDRPLKRRIADQLTSWITLFLQAVHTPYAWANMRFRGEMDPFIKDPIAEPGKKRLVVLLHGLNASPAQYRPFMQAMQKEEQFYAESTFYVPPIYEKGRAGLKEMAEKITPFINQWVENHGQEQVEVTLVGISNGGRLLSTIGSEVLKQDQVGKCTMISMVGASKGSSWLHLAHMGDGGQKCLSQLGVEASAPRRGLHWIAHKITRLFVSQENYEELLPGSDSLTTTLAALDDEIAKNPQKKVQRLFVASAADWVIGNPELSLPASKHPNCHYQMVYGQGHNSAGSLGRLLAKYVVKFPEQTHSTSL